MSRSSLWRAVALAAVAAVALAGCGGAAGGARRGNSAVTAALSTCQVRPNTCNSAGPGTLRHGGQLVFAIDKNVTNWNVLSSEGSVFEGGEVLKPVLPAAFVTQPDLAVALNTDLLDSVQVITTNPETIVYKIKANAVWSDGTPITAADFRYNWEIQNGRDCPACPVATTSGYDQVHSVLGAADGKTVTVTFTTPFTDWRQLWSGSSPIYPAHIAAAHGDITTPRGLAASFAWFGETVPTYSGGPFRIAQVTNNESVTLVPNPRWYGPRPKLDRLIYRIVTDLSRELVALRGREVQVSYPRPQTDFVRQARGIPGVSSFVGPGLSWEHFDLNLQNSYLADRVLRTALFTAVDRQAIIDRTVGQFTNTIKPLNSHTFVPRQSGYEDVLSETGQGSGNLVRAKQILAAAGYQIDGGQLTTLLGMPVPPMRIRYTVGNEVRRRECELFAQQVKPLGVTVQVVPTNDLAGTLLLGDYDIVVFSWVMTPFSYSAARQLWVTGQGDNVGRYSNPNVDRLIAAAASSTDTLLAKEELNQADRRMTRDAYVLPLYQKPTFLALDDNVANVRDNSSFDGPPYNTAQWGLRAGR